MGTVTIPGWIINPIHAVGLSPGQYKIVCILFWADLDPVSFWAASIQFQKILKIFSKTLVIFSRIFLSILVNIGLYFYIVKIQIWY
jgi:hypothetical protein